MRRIPGVAAALLVIAAIYPSISAAQQRFGVIWDVPEDETRAIEELERFRELKIRYIEVSELLSPPVWREIGRQNFGVYVQIPVYYPVVETFADASPTLLTTYQQFLSGYAGRDIEAIGAFAYGQTNNSRFAAAVAPFVEQIDSALNIPVYYKSWQKDGAPYDRMFDFSIRKIDVGPGFQARPDTSTGGTQPLLYAPSNELSHLVTPVKWFIDRAGNNISQHDRILFFDSRWLLDFVNTYQPATDILAEHATYHDAVFPLPEEQLPGDSDHSPIVLILLIVWGSVAINYSFMPTYRRSLFRFFLSHRFFTEDVMKRHIRTLVPSLVIIVQHAVLGGIFLYCLASLFLSAAGLDLIHHYYPFFLLFGEGFFSFFLIGSSFTLLFQIICLAWLYFANRRVGYLSQVSILYSWPFHLNLLVTTVTVTLFVSGGNHYLLYSFLVLFLLVLFLDFPITAFDTGKIIKKRRGLYALGTLGLYVVLLSVVLLLLLTNSYLGNILSLAVTIS